MGEALRVAVLHADDEPLPERTIEDLMAELLRVCRRRTGQTAEQFAGTITKMSTRHPGLMGSHIRAAEDGTHPLPADLMAHAVTRAGIDVAAILSALVGLAG